MLVVFVKIGLVSTLVNFIDGSSGQEFPLKEVRPFFLFRHSLLNPGNGPSWNAKEGDGEGLQDTHPFPSRC